MQIDLPYPPSANRYFRIYNGRAVTSDEARTYKRTVGLLCTRAGVEPVAGDVAVNIHIRRPAKRRDIDNHLKVTLDALQEYAYNNDSQITELHVTMCDNKQHPGVTVTVTEKAAV